MYPKLRVVASLVLLATLACAPLAAQPPTPARKSVQSDADLPVASYVSQVTKASDLLSDDAAFAALAERLRADTEAQLRDYDIRDASTLIRRHELLQWLALLRGDVAEARSRGEAIRGLHADAAKRTTSGLLEEAAAAALDAGDDKAAREAAYAAAVRERLAQADWASAGRPVTELNGTLSLWNDAVLLGVVQSDIDPAFAANQQLSWAQARRIAWLRYVSAFELRYFPQSRAEFERWIAANRVVRPDIWQARQVDMASRDDLAPVTVAIWDSGVDTALFPGQLWSNPKETVDGRDDDGNGFIDDVHGIAWEPEDWVQHRSRGDLLALPDGFAGRIDTLADHFQGTSDLLAGLDSEAAQAARARMAAMPPEALGAYYQDIGLYMGYAHGTHVAGIAAAGNPAARLLSARMSAHWAIPPPLFDDAAAQSHAVAMRDAIAYFKAHGVRVVNMSWGYSPAMLTGLIAQAGAPGTPEDHRRQAEARFAVMHDALDAAIAGAPNILFIAGAGNSANDASFDRFIPSGLSHPNLLTVGAVDQAGDAASFTSSGALVRVYASGVDVASVVPGGRKVSMSGTSMAAPQVTNLAAKLLAIDPSLTPQQVIALILEASTPSDDGKRRLMHAARSIELLEARRKTP